LADLSEFASLGEVGKVYPAEGIFNTEAGALTAWLRVEPGQPEAPCAVFHTDDSRYVLYFTQEPGREEGYRLVGRAGGNRKAFDPALGRSRFPEVSVPVGSARLPEGEWLLVTLTWDGYPRGSMRLYLGAEAAGERLYDRRHDNGEGLASLLSVGMRPAYWSGELAQQEDGTLADLRPGTLMAVPPGIELRDLRLYPRALDPAEIDTLARETHPEGLRS
jgi:hypothetical protein